MGNCFGSKQGGAGGPSGIKKADYVDVKKSNRASDVSVKQGVKHLKKVYNVKEKPFGKGAFGRVYLGSDKKNPDFKVAIKVIKKSKLSDEDLKGIMDEVKVLNQVDHPNITKYFETYDDADFLYLVMEYCPGGELFDG